jgi:hypothetical protein
LINYDLCLDYLPFCGTWEEVTAAALLLFPAEKWIAQDRSVQSPDKKIYITSGANRRELIEYFHRNDKKDKYSPLIYNVIYRHFRVPPDTKREILAKLLDMDDFRAAMWIAARNL